MPILNFLLLIFCLTLVNEPTLLIEGNGYPSLINCRCHLLFFNIFDVAQLSSKIASWTFWRTDFSSLLFFCICFCALLLCFSSVSSSVFFFCTFLLALLLLLLLKKKIFCIFFCALLLCFSPLWVLLVVIIYVVNRENSQ